MSVQYVDIDNAEDTGQRVDNYLLRILKGVPRQHIYRILRRGEVRVNGGRVKATYRLKLNDRIRIPPVRQREELPVQFSDTAANELVAAVIHEDDDYLLLNKPAGVAVHGGSGLSAGVVEIMRVATGVSRLELVHRLDRDTSGCLALAKNRAALLAAQEQFRKRTVKKIYEVYVAGTWPKSMRTVQLKLLRYEAPHGERRVRVSSRGQTARTDFQVLDNAGALASRLQATLHTGRTHQIRVHTNASGHGILGDDKYVPDSQRNPSVAWVERLCLHARKLTIPLEDRTLKVEAPLDEEMRGIWRNLKALAEDESRKSSASKPRR
jgi:23S rRNA pseudouridine955/2504/2580 synthase